MESSLLYTFLVFIVFTSYYRFSSRGVLTNDFVGFGDKRGSPKTRAYLFFLYSKLLCDIYGTGNLILARIDIFPSTSLRM